MNDSTLIAPGAPENQKDVLSNNAYRAIKVRYDEMQKNALALDAVKLKAMARQDISDLAIVTDKDKAQKGAIVIAHNMKAPSYSEGAKAAIREIEEVNPGAAKRMHDMLGTARDSDKAREKPAVEIIPKDWDQDQGVAGRPGSKTVKQPDQEAVNSIEPVTVRKQERPLNGNSVESDEILTARKGKDVPVIPAEVQREYVSVGNKYYSAQNPKDVAFEDKGNRLETKDSGEKISSNLVKIAEARGWDEIKVSGTQEFKREVWAEAAARGMQVKGYTPSEQDKADLAARMATKSANAVEEAKARDQLPQDKEKEIRISRANAFQNEPREEALKKHPELAGAYAAQAAMHKRIEMDRMPQREQEIVKARVMSNLASSIEQGKLPNVERREELTRAVDAREERGMER